MTQVLFLQGSDQKMCGILNLLASRAQSNGSVVFIDATTTFDPEFIEDLSGHIRDITLCRPKSTYQLRSLIDTKLPRKFGDECPYLVIVAGIGTLFDLIDVSEREYVLDYAIDSLSTLVGNGTLVLASTRKSCTSATQAKAKADVIINVDKATSKPDALF